MLHGLQHLSSTTMNWTYILSKGNMGLTHWTIRNSQGWTNSQNKVLQLILCLLTGPWIQYGLQWWGLAWSWGFLLLCTFQNGPRMLHSTVFQTNSLWDHEWCGSWNTYSSYLSRWERDFAPLSDMMNVKIEWCWCWWTAVDKDSWTSV